MALVLFNLTARSRDFLLIGPCDRMQTVVERSPDAAVRVIIAKGSGGRGALFLAEANELGAEPYKLIDTLCQILDIRLLRGNGIGLPGACDLLQFAELADEIFREGLGGAPIRRHVNAARFHHHGVNEPVDSLEVDRAARDAVEGRVIPPGDF